MLSSKALSIHESVMLQSLQHSVLTGLTRLFSNANLSQITSPQTRTLTETPANPTIPETRIEVREVSTAPNTSSTKVPLTRSEKVGFCCTFVSGLLLVTAGCLLMKYFDNVVFVIGLILFVAGVMCMSIAVKESFCADINRIP